MVRFPTKTGRLAQTDGTWKYCIAGYEVAVTRKSPDTPPRRLQAVVPLEGEIYRPERLV